MAYTTACTTVQAVIFSERFSMVNVGELTAGWIQILLKYKGWRQYRYCHSNWVANTAGGA